MIYEAIAREDENIFIPALYICSDPDVPVNPIYGETITRDPLKLRESSALMGQPTCGPDAKWFEAKEA